MTSQLTTQEKAKIQDLISKVNLELDDAKNSGMHEFFTKEAKFVKNFTFVLDKDDAYNVPKKTHKQAAKLWKKIKTKCISFSLWSIIDEIEAETETLEDESAYKDLLLELSKNVSALRRDILEQSDILKIVLRLQIKLIELSHKRLGQHVESIIKKFSVLKREERYANQSIYDLQKSFSKQYKKLLKEADKYDAFIATIPSFTFKDGHIAC